MWLKDEYFFAFIKTLMRIKTTFFLFSNLKYKAGAKQRGENEH